MATLSGRTNAYLVKIIYAKFVMEEYAHSAIITLRRT
jgi:hypothetical protein